MQQRTRRGIQAAVVTGGLWMMGAGFAAADHGIVPTDGVLPPVDTTVPAAVDPTTLDLEQPALIDSEDTNVAATLPRELSDGGRPEGLGEAVRGTEPLGVPAQGRAHPELEQVPARLGAAVQQAVPGSGERAAKRPADHVIPFVGPLDDLLAADEVAEPEDFDPFALNPSDYLLPATGVPALPVDGVVAPPSVRSDIPAADLVEDTVLLPAVGQLDLAGPAVLPAADLPEADVPELLGADLPELPEAELPEFPEAELPDLPGAELPTMEYPGLTDALAALEQGMPARAERDLPTTQFHVPELTEATSNKHVQIPLDRELQTDKLGRTRSDAEAFRGTSTDPVEPSQVGSMSGYLPLDELYGAEEAIDELPTTGVGAHRPDTAGLVSIATGQRII